MNSKLDLKSRTWRNWDQENVTNGPTSHLPPLARKYCTFSHYQSSHAVQLGAGQCGINNQMALTLCWMSNFFHPPEIDFLPKPRKPPDGLISEIVFGTLVFAIYSWMLTCSIPRFYWKKFIKFSTKVYWRIFQNHFPKGFRIVLSLLNTQNCWNLNSVIEGDSRPIFAIQLSP